MMRCIIAVAALVITVAFTASTNADDLGDQIKAKVKQKIAKKLDLTGPRVIDNTNNVSGEDNAVVASADGSQNVSVSYREGDITYTDSRQWHDSHNVQTTTSDSRQWNTATTTTDSRRWKNTTTAQPYCAPVAVQPYCAPRVVTVQPYCPPTPRFVASPRLTYATVTDDCGDTISIRCWASCGGYFIDSEGRRFNLLASFSKVPASSRHLTLTGRYWRNTSGVLMFTAIWPCGTQRTFIDP